jgi:hypothetical protein
MPRQGKRVNRWQIVREVSLLWMEDSMLRFTLVVAVLCCFSNVVRADPVTFQFTGRVSQVPIDEVFGDIAFGNSITGDFTFESTAVDGVPGDPPHVGSYQAPAGLPYVFNVTIAGHSFSASDFLGIGIFNAAVDQYSVLAQNNLFSESLQIFLQDSSGSVFANDSLPLSPPPLAAFDISPVAFSLDATFAPGEVQVDGYVDSLTCGPGCTATPTPEPSAVPILLGAFAWVAFRTTRIRNHKRREH